MSVIILTIFLSLLLVGFFIAFFLSQQRRRRFTSTESDSLLPFSEEKPRAADGQPLRKPCSSVSQTNDLARP